MKYCYYILFITSFGLFAQEKETVFVDSNYYEDQFYIGINYINLANRENNIENIGIPYSFEVGIIKDIPLNKRRNIGLGVGLGYSFDVLRPNIAILNNDLDLEITNSFNDYTYNSHYIEIPLEFRWRTSTHTKYRFWRIYTGVSFLYKFSDRSEFTLGDETTVYKNSSIFNTTNGTIYTSIGFGTWNFHVKYYLRSTFINNTLTTNNQSVNFNALKMGVMFYLM